MSAPLRIGCCGAQKFGRDRDIRNRSYSIHPIVALPKDIRLPKTKCSTGEITWGSIWLSMLGEDCPAATPRNNSILDSRARIAIGKSAQIGREQVRTHGYRVNRLSAIFGFA